MDIVKFIRMQKLFRIIVKNLFTPIERHLLRNQQCFVVDSEDVELSHESEDDKLTHEHNIHANSSPYFVKFLEGALRK